VENVQAEELQALNDLPVEQQDNALNNIRNIDHQRNSSAWTFSTEKKIK
jgi:hypothetical protein